MLLDALTHIISSSIHLPVQLLTNMTVKTPRRSYSINKMARDHEPWTSQEDALLGTEKDRIIAAKLKRSSTAVSNRRLKLGIPAAKNRQLAEQPDVNKNDPASDPPGFIRGRNEHRS
jgi:hypothetical protein